MKSRTKITKIVCLFAAFGVSFAFTGCGYVHGTDGRTTTIIGLGRTTEGKTQMEAGWGKGMSSNLSKSRAGTFSDRSSAATSVLGGN